MKIKKDTIEEALERESLPVKAIERIEDVCIHVVDNTGKIVCYSKGCEKIENMKHEDVIGKDSHTLYNYVENESMQDYVLKTGKKFRMSMSSMNPPLASWPMSSAAPIQSFSRRPEKRGGCHLHLPGYLRLYAHGKNH